MRFKRRIQVTAVTVLTTLLMACGSIVPAYAYTGEEADAGTEAVTVAEETAAATETEEGADTSAETGAEAPAAETESDGNTDESQRDVSGALTPDGSLTLVDDLDGESTGALQFMTVTTRDGNYYYIIIDRSGDSENVYFLNAVDAADLMNLMSDEEKEQYTDAGTDTSQETETPLIVEETPAEETPAEEETEASQASPLASSLPILIVFLVIGGLITGGYYLLKIKPGKKQGSVDEDLEFYDDEDFEREEEETEEEDPDDDMIILEEDYTKENE